MQATSSFSPTHARQSAVKILADILDHKKSWEEAIGACALFHTLAERDRNFTHLLVMTTLRRLGQIDALLAAIVAKPLQGKSNTVLHCLRLGTAQLLWLGTPAHATVHSMVETVAALNCAPMKGLVNAVLKRIDREGHAIIALQDEAQINVPTWLYASWENTYGAQTARAIALSRLDVPPLDITVKENAEAWTQKLNGVLLPTGSIRIREAGRVEALPGYQEGAWWVQDAAAALPALMLGDVRGKTVLDLCAAPGGKTAQLVAQGARVIALDKSALRVKKLKDNMQRLNVMAKVVQADALAWKPESPVDAILLDAPCSATGTLRRHPEIVYHRTKDDIKRLAKLQKALLERASRWLKISGKLVYCVCSLQPEEGEEQIRLFLKENQQFDRVPKHEDAAQLKSFSSPNGILRTHSGMSEYRGGMDGFFAICLQRVK